MLPLPSNNSPTLIPHPQNHEDVFVVVDPTDYPALLAQLKSDNVPGGIALKRHLAWKAFQHVASYDAAVAEWLWSQNTAGDPTTPTLLLDPHPPTHPPHP